MFSNVHYLKYPKQGIAMMRGKSLYYERIKSQQGNLDDALEITDGCMYLRENQVEQL